MAFVGVLSSQLLYDRFIKQFTSYNKTETKENIEHIKEFNWGDYGTD